MEESWMKLEKIYSPIKGELNRIETELRAQVLSSKDKFILQVNRYLLDMAGKRLRPSLLLLCAKTNNHWNEKAIHVAVSLELIHTASLVHDDVLDEADVRRNKAVLNARWGNEPAILTGDYLYFKAFSILSQLEVPRISSIVSLAAEQMCEGEIIQTCKTRQLDLSEEAYLEIIRKKTASLMAASCEAGAVLSGSHPSLQKALARYGLNFGMAFQIIDDCQDLTASPGETGKSTYKDIEQGKMTLPLIYLVKRASKKDKQALINLFERKREEVIALLARYETIALSLQRAKEYLIKAKDELKAVENSEAKDALYQLGDYLLKRVEIVG